MTEAEKQEIVGLVMTQISSQAVDFDIATEEPKANDLLTAVRETESGGYRGVTIKWDDVARIATELANQAATRAEQAKKDAVTAKNIAQEILTGVQNKDAEITNFVATSKSEIDTQKNESVNAVKSVYQTDLNELKGDIVDLNNELFIVGNNILDPISQKKNCPKYIDTDGSVITTSTRFSVSNPIDKSGNYVVPIYLNSLGNESVPADGVWFGFYNENTFISKVQSNGNPISIPNNTTHIRVMLDVDYTNVAERIAVFFTDESSIPKFEKYTKYVNNDIIKFDKTNIIEVGEGKSFNNLRLAINSITDSAENNKYIVKLYNGIYETVDESLIGKTDPKTGIIYKGLIIPDWVSIVGIGERSSIIIKGTLPTPSDNRTKYADQANTISTINLVANGTVENVTIKSKNLRYCNHDDTDAFGMVESSHTFRNVYFVCEQLDSDINTASGRGVTAICCGIGGQLNKEIIFENCIFQNMNLSKDAILIHDNGESERGCRLKVECCKFMLEQGGIDLQIYTNSNIPLKCYANVVGNEFTKGICMQSLSNVSINNWYLYAICNKNYNLYKDGGISTLDISNYITAFGNFTN